MKKIFLSFVLVFVSMTLFAQKTVASDAAILKLMNARKGMVSVNSLVDNMTKNMNEKDAKNYRLEMDVFKKQLIDTALTTFKKDYTAVQIDAIYKECTSDIIDYSDLTNNFFKKWRNLKGNLYFAKAKETYFKYQ